MRRPPAARRALSLLLASGLLLPRPARAGSLAPALRTAGAVLGSASAPPAADIRRWYELVWRVNSWRLFAEDGVALDELPAEQRRELTALDLAWLSAFKERVVQAMGNEPALAGLEGELASWEARLSEALRFKKLLFARIQDLKIYLREEGGGAAQRAHLDSLHKIKSRLLGLEEFGQAQFDWWDARLSRWEAEARRELAPDMSDEERDALRLLYRKRQGLGRSSPRLEEALGAIRKGALDGSLEQGQALDLFYDKVALLGLGDDAPDADAPSPRAGPRRAEGPSRDAPRAQLPRRYAERRSEPPPPRGSGAWDPVWPVANPRIPGRGLDFNVTNPRRSRIHHGVDLFVKGRRSAEGLPVVSVEEGVVQRLIPEMKVVRLRGGGTRRTRRTSGNTVVIKHPNGWLTYYMHLRDFAVKAGEEVARGEVIGSVGHTGNARPLGAAGAHVHFEIRVPGSRGRYRAVDPMPRMR